MEKAGNDLVLCLGLNTPGGWSSAPPGWIMDNGESGGWAAADW